MGNLTIEALALARRSGQECSALRALIEFAQDRLATLESGTPVTAYAELTDKATADLPALNTPLAAALAAKAALAGGNAFTGAHTIQHSENPPLDIRRTTSVTSSTAASGAVTAISSGDVADGFGPIFQFRISDTGISDTLLGAIGFLRAGADNTGDFVVRTQVAGSATERLRVTAAGTLVMGSATISFPSSATLSGTNTGDDAPNASSAPAVHTHLAADIADAVLTGKTATVTLATAAAGVRQVNHADAAVSLGDIIHPTFAPLPDQENDMEEIHDSRLQLYATALAGSIDFSIVSHLPIRGPIRIHYTIHKP
jgi:hypothetical protein